MASLEVHKASQQQKPPEQPKRRGLFGRSKSEPASPVSMPSLNLAGEINKIVQARLMYSPLAGTTQIDIISAPDGGIQIRVNDKFYSSPDDIDDPEVKELIKSSIKEWERS